MDGKIAWCSISMSPPKGVCTTAVGVQGFKVSKILVCLEHHLRCPIQPSWLSVKCLNAVFT